MGRGDSMEGVALLLGILVLAALANAMSIKEEEEVQTATQVARGGASMILYLLLFVLLIIAAPVIGVTLIGLPK
jgi:uncharacterized membrane protein YjgN (DUF898 family)